MSIQFQCPNCKTVYEVADDLAGKFIMCRGCQKRGPVRSLSGSTGPAATASAASPTRRNFLAITVGVVGAIGAITTGAVMARWKQWFSPYTTELRNPDMTTQRRRRGPRGPQEGEDTKEKKEGT